MKICIISNLYPPFVRGGAEIIAAMEAEGLKKAWQHVFAISSRPRVIKIHGQSVANKVGFFSVSRDEVNEVDVRRFAPMNLYYYLDDFKYPVFIRLLWHFFDIFNIFSYFTIRKVLKEEKPDVVISHNLMGIGFLIPSLIRRLKIKHVHTLHDIQLVTPSGLIVKGKENSLEHKFFKAIGYVKIMRWLMGSPDIVISPSKFLLDFYQQNKFFSKSKKLVVANPIKNLIKIKKQSSPKLELLFLGQVHKAKGVLELIKNFKKIKLPHLKLHIVGVGQDLATAKELAGDDKRIKFYGWLPHSHVIPLLSKIDVVLVPSLCYENSPSVIYESLGMGIPVLAADIGGTAELIKEGHNGWIFPAGDFEVFNKKIVSLYKQREKIAPMAANCQASVSKYLLDNYIKKVLELIQQGE
ncbi:glycosyltransferase [bacterium]|nr:glycosyltransferase [bacterium]